MIDTQKMGHPSEMPVGNEAKLRETLVAVKKSIDEIGASSLDGDPEILMMSLTQVCARLSARIDAALDAPPRNCDRYATPNDAMKAFEAFMRQQGKLGFINPYTEAFKWLFAPATAAGGGDDGR